VLNDLELPVMLSARDGEFLVRPAVEHDLDALIELIANDPISAARGDTADPADRAAYARGLAEVQADPRNVQLVAERDGAVIGTLQLTVLPGISRQGASRVQVEAVRVRDDLRSSGIGRAFLRWVAEDAAPSLGASLIQLTSDASRTGAHRFYERLGYAASHVGYKLSV